MKILAKRISIGPSAHDHLVEVDICINESEDDKIFQYLVERIGSSIELEDRLQSALLERREEADAET